MPAHPASKMKSARRKAEEMAESPEEEASEAGEYEEEEEEEEEDTASVRQGSAGSSGGRKRKSSSSPQRKQRWGTKTAGMKDSACGCSGKAGGKCDGNCSGKRGDALTAPEYLAACDLGIQDRPRTYIRARLDAAAQIREDLKCGPGTKPCGKACIPKENKCRLTAGHKAGTALTIAGSAIQTAGFLGTITGVGIGNAKQVGRNLQLAAAGQALTAAGARAKGYKKESNTMLRRAGLQAALGTSLTGDIGRAGRAAKAGARASAGKLSALKGRVTQRSARARLERQFRRNEQDAAPSPYASGFAFDSVTLAL